jgi:hypothetical protein
MAELAEWDSFYVIVGSAAGGLIGLQFVVMTLIADRAVAPAAEVGAAYATPTIVYFCTALLLSAVLRAPWHALAPIAALCGLVGVLGTGYACITAARMRTQMNDRPVATYQPVFEDWSFHVLLPLAAYLDLSVSALSAPLHLGNALFGVGAAVLLLLFIGIHNSWDAVAYHVFSNRHSPGER